MRETRREALRLFFFFQPLGSHENVQTPCSADVLSTGQTLYIPTSYTASANTMKDACSSATTKTI